jgi:hypothetical protein
MTIRDRILEFRRVPASQLRPNPKNWRTHPPFQQDALRGVLAEIGYADALLARRLEDGSLLLIDGHLRAETTPDMEVPVLVLDLNEKEADLLLTVLDPLAALATADRVQLAALAQNLETEHPALLKLANQLSAQSPNPAEAAGEPDLAEIEIPETYQLVVTCRDEAEQRELFERLRGEGYPCRVLSL